MSKIATGIYKHYKGAEYEVLGLVRHSETEEQLVVYRALYGDYGLWVRPLTMFIETVTVGDADVARFQLVKEYDQALGHHAP